MGTRFRCLILFLILLIFSCEKSGINDARGFLMLQKNEANDIFTLTNNTGSFILVLRNRDLQLTLDSLAFMEGNSGEYTVVPEFFSVMDTLYVSDGASVEISLDAIVGKFSLSKSYFHVLKVKDENFEMQVFCIQETSGSFSISEI